MLKKYKNIISLLFYIFKKLDLKLKWRFFYLILLSCITAVAEVVSLGTLVPLVSIFINPEQIEKSNLINLLLVNFKFLNKENILFYFPIFFIILSLVNGVLRLLLLNLNIKFSKKVGINFSNIFYYNTIYQPYSFHINSNSSEIISGVTQKINAVISAVMSVTVLITSLIVGISIIITLLNIDLTFSFFAILIFSISYLIIGKYSKSKLNFNSNLIAIEQTKIVKNLQEAFGGIREVIIDHSHDYFINEYKNSISKLQKAMAQNTFLNQAPRYFMETVAIISVCFFLIFINLDKFTSVTVIPIIAVMAVGAQRLLPLFQQIYGHWSVLNGSFFSIQEVLKVLDENYLPIKNYNNKEITFKNSLSFQNLYFRYNEQNEYILKNINFTILKGDKIGIIGNSGSGKSTFLDLIMCLLSPTKGNILVDDKIMLPCHYFNWQKKIAHVSQNIFLSDASIAENIVFGSENKINYEKLILSCEKACILDFINQTPKKFETRVGERGVQLSGGQKQRLGIARSLYKGADILILDEATSALDSETEDLIIKSLFENNKNLTLIMVAHRISSLRFCNIIHEIKDRNIIRSCGFSEL